MSEHEVIHVNSDDDLPENIFDGKVRTLIYPSGMEMTIGVDRDSFRIAETPEEFQERMEREDREWQKTLAANPKLKAELDSVDALESWLS